MVTAEHTEKYRSREGSHTADFHQLYMPHTIMRAVKARKTKKAGHIFQTGTEVHFVKGVFRRAITWMINRKMQE
jgi:hypothetical protein